jgi:hypothetical protein
MSYQKIQSKGASAEYSIKPDEVGEAPRSAGSQGWQLCLINTTNKQFEFASLRHRQGDFGPWFRIPAVKNNCPTGYDMCFDKQIWSVILSLPADPQSFDIRVATGPNSFGFAVGTEFLGVKPEPGTSGGVLGIAIDG